MGGQEAQNQNRILLCSHHPNPQARLGCQSGWLLSAALCGDMVGGPFPDSSQGSPSALGGACGL